MRIEAARRHRAAAVTKTAHDGLLQFECQIIVFAAEGRKSTETGGLLTKRLAFNVFLIYIDPKYREVLMKDILILVGIFAAWYILNRWLLPRMGVQT